MTKPSSSWNRHQLEGDGNIQQLFHYLWKKNKHLESCPGVLIPDTVVYEHNFPVGWYYFAESELKKYSGKELETKAIYNHFTKNIDHSHGIVATFLSTHDDEDETVNRVEFLTAEDLHDFLFKRKQRDKGLLQKFITPKGSHNSQIQAIWSPHVTLLERRVNIHRLSDKKNYTPYERAVTTEGPSHYSNEVFCAPKLQDQIKKICQNIVNHFEEVEHKKITRMVLYFKVSKKGQLYLLWSSSIRVASNHNSPGSPKGDPLNLSPKFKSDQLTDGSLDMNSVKTFIEETSNMSSDISYRSHVPNPDMLLKSTQQRLKAQQQNEKKPPPEEKEEVDPKGRMTPAIRDCIKDLDDESKEEMTIIDEVLNDLLYEAYSHFLHDSEPFYFEMPKILKEAFADKLNEMMSKLKIEKAKDSDLYYIPNQKVSIGKLQAEFGEFKKYCLSCYKQQQKN